MKLRHGGYTPVLSGRPSGLVEELPVPSSLAIELNQDGIIFEPVVADGAKVTFGEELAAADGPYGRLVLPAPASGTVKIGGEDGSPRIALDHPEVDQSGPARGYDTASPERVTRSSVRESLVRGGLWQGLWSEAANGIPHTSDSTAPRAVIVNCIFTEPFRARGNVVIERSWDTIISGIRFLEHLAADYGKIEVVLTAPNHPLAKKMYADLAGFAWVRFHPVSLKYPVEHPRILADMLRREDRRIRNEDDIWVIGVQDVDGLGSILAHGRPPSRRIVAVGGPGCENPRHVSAVIGTQVGQLASGEDVVVLRGGIMNGLPVDPAKSGITGRDDGLFMLPECTSREMLGFVRPGFNRTSYSRTFVSRLTGAKDSHITASLRGEPRPCIACGSCEDVCPVRLLPQVMHRYLYSGRIDDAERVGLMHCIDCRLCTYVCPSKIELQQEFAEARNQLEAEREEAHQAAMAERDQDDEPREDWYEAPKKDS